MYSYKFLEASRVNNKLDLKSQFNYLTSGISSASSGAQDLRLGRAMALTWPDPALLFGRRPRPDPTLLNRPGRRA